MDRRAVSSACGDVELGDRHAGRDTGVGEDLAAGVDHLGAADEAQRPERAGLVGRHPHDLVLQGARPVEEVEAALPAVLGQVGGRVGPGARPGRDADADLRAVEGERAGGLGERLVVADHHADPADRRVEGAEPVAGGVAGVLAERLVHLAVVAEHAVAGHADRAVVAARRRRPRSSRRRRPSRRRAPRGRRDLRAVHGERGRAGVARRRRRG